MAEALATTRPRTTRLGRLADYISEMFPPLVRIPINTLNFLVVYFGLQVLSGISPLSLSWKAIAGALTVQLLWLFIRVYDEFKDAESDLALARAGDKRFINRPLVTGRVTLEDISILRWWMTAVIIALNVVFFDQAILFGLLISFGFITLAFKWFFYPAMSSNIIFVYITHLPNALVIQIYTLAVFISEFGLPPALPAIELMFGLWMTVGAYEFSYKIRVPADETEYMTYSKVLGMRPAVYVAVAQLSISVCGYLAFISYSSLPTWISVVVATAGGVAIFACFRLLMRPRSALAKLTRETGIYWIASTASIVIGSAIHSGLILVF